MPQDANHVPDDAIVKLLREAPDRWAPLAEDALTALQEQALKLLTAAGMVERQFSIRLSLIGHPIRLDVMVRATGEHGLADAMTPVLQKAWKLWGNHYRDKHAESGDTAPAFFCERTGPERWRLTDQGVLALEDLDAGHEQRVVDFVQRRTVVFEGKVVPGHGQTERLEEAPQTPAPTPVEVTNFEELSQPMQQMQAMMERMFEQMMSMAGHQKASTTPHHDEVNVKQPSQRKRGPDRLPLDEAWRYLTIVQEWAGIQEQNKKRRMKDRYQKVQLAEKHGLSLEQLDAMLAWYRKNRNAGHFPDDPRTLSRGELEESFE